MKAREFAANPDYMLYLDNFESESLRTKRIVGELFVDSTRYVSKDGGGLFYKPSKRVVTLSVSSEGIMTCEGGGYVYDEKRRLNFFVVGKLWDMLRDLGRFECRYDTSGNRIYVVNYENRGVLENTPGILDDFKELVTE